MAKSKQQIINDIVSYLSGYAYKDCYVGITANAEKRVFTDHNVTEHSGRYIWRTASSNKVAREIEKHFLDAGMDGGGGGSGTARIVYAYKKVPYRTKQ